MLRITNILAAFALYVPYTPIASLAIGTSSILISALEDSNLSVSASDTITTRRALRLNAIILYLEDTLATEVLSRYRQ